MGIEALLETIELQGWNGVA